MKKILGLDLGTTSIGWAFVKEAEDGESESSAIVKIGVRVNPLTTDEQQDFEKGKPVSVNANRTLKRGARKNLQRYKQRRKNLIEVLKKHALIADDSILAENEKDSTHSTYALRAKAALEEISKEELARILLMINKKRGYKSSRKAINEDEGQAIDGMAIAKRLYTENLTPGQLSYELLKERKKYLPDFYRSDLTAEFNRVWDYQTQFYPDILTKELKKELEGKGQKATSAIFWTKFKFNTAENKGTREEKKLQAYKWRSLAINTRLAIEEVAFVVTEINNNINGSSGYLGAISDRSKELYFNKETIGQYLYKQLKNNRRSRIKNQVFYRQDYLDEFEIIWETQALYHSELTQKLKEEIRDIIIFYQRKLKSQKGLVSFCEFESKQVEHEIAGKKVFKTIGAKVIPKSSPLFQEFKIWQNLNNLELKHKKDRSQIFIKDFDLEIKLKLFNELNIKGNLSKGKVLENIMDKPNEWELNYPTIEGNRTNQALYEAYFKMMELEGDEEVNLEKLTAPEINALIFSFFETQQIDTSLLNFNAELDGKDFEIQPLYQFWHLLYAYEGDNSVTGNDKLYELLKEKFGFKREYAAILANINLQNDYGSLSAKAIRKIFPFIKENNYSEGCKLAGYNHSSSITKEENDERPLKSKLCLLPKNSLRNPIVEKILNQMVNVVNTIIDDPMLGKPDEIRIELARELKKNAREREEDSKRINDAKNNHDKIREIIIKEDGVKNPSRNDIIRYKLYQELRFNAYKDLYTNEYIARQDLFTKKYDIDHIIPQASLFDDSFSNKTLVPRHANEKKGNRTAFDYIDNDYGAVKLAEYLERVETLYQVNNKSKEEGVGKAKYKKLLLKGTDIGQGFIERDLRDSQYISKKAKDMLKEICRIVVPTTGSITDKLRDDWGLVNVMQELNMDKYRKLGLTEMVEKKDGGFKERIVEWTKRNDHRHHAMDALTIAFTKHEHIQYLNNLNAKAKNDKKGKGIFAIEKKITENYENENRRFISPIRNFRQEAKNHLENVLISCKAKNKVVTKNKNKTKSAKGDKVKQQLTPRGQLHKETVYGKIQQYVIKEEKINAKFDEETIFKVSKPQYNIALLKRLHENNNDPVKAFTGKNSPSKNPIYLNDQQTIQVPEKVKLVWLEDDFTIRKDISPDLKIEKVVDMGIQNILYKRLERFNNNEKEAFSNLDKNPIWLNEEKGILIKRVTISGVKSAEPLHFKKDHHGKNILDNEGKPIPVDFVSTGNNHHVAIYRDENGNLQDEVISLHKVITERVNQGLPVIDKTYNQHLGWNFLFTMKQNEYFIFPSKDFDPLEIDLLDPFNNKLISPNLFRVQKFSKVTYGNSSVRDYVFRHHFETSVEDKKELKDITYKSIKSLQYFEGIVKVRINHIGQIVKVGEY